MLKQRIVDAVLRNPYPVYAVVRRVSPVLHDRLHGLWMLFDYGSVKHALHDHEAFSSRAAPPGGKPLDWMIFQDPPVHTKLRALVMKTFTPRAIAALEPRIAKISSDLFDKVIERGEMDFAADFSIPLPLIVIAELLGIPADDRPLFMEWSKAILGLAETIAGGERAEAAKKAYRLAKEQMGPYVAHLVELRRAHPEDDLITRLGTAEVDGERLSEEEILSFFQLLLLAGSETTTNLIGNALLCFLDHPDQFSRVRAERSLLPGAIDEVLRYRTPVQMLFRATTRDVELHGRVIPRDQLVLLMVGSANRDPMQFDHANRFDITRNPNPHIAFGHGIHFCIGSALARLEARVALGQLLDRLHDIQRTGDPWQPREAFNIHGPSRLLIRFRPGSRASSEQVRARCPVSVLEGR